MWQVGFMSQSATDDDLFAPLGRRPDATTLTVRELITRVREGRIRKPEFQRPLRWTAEDNRRLIDSLWRGYPIGSLLMWKRKADAGEIIVAGTAIDVPAHADAWWVVDGQQRVMALAGALLELPMRDPRWLLHFDPELPAFKVGAPTPQREARDVPLVAMGDLKRLGRWIRDSEPDEATIERIEEAQQRILDYSVPIYVVESDDERPLRAGFARLNSTGARMRADEVFQALLGLPREGAGLDLTRLAEHCNQLGFGTPPRVELLKAVLAMSGQDPARRVENLPERELGKLVSQVDVEAALTATIEFLVQDCGIPHVRLIPYPVVFFILARWFHLFSDSAPEVRSLLACWVWRGAVTGTHERAAVSKMRLQVNDIKGDATTSVERLLARVSRTRPDERWKLKSFHHRNAHSRIEMLALLELEPQDLNGPVPLVALVADSSRIAREIVSVQNVDASLRQLAQTAANRVLLDAADTNLQTTLRGWNPSLHNTELESHLIDLESCALMESRNWESFFVHRTARIELAVAGMLARRCGWDEPELRPPESYIEVDDLNLGL